MKALKVVESTNAGAVVAGSTCPVDEFLGRLAANDAVIEVAKQSGVPLESVKALLKESGRLLKLVRPLHCSD